MAGEGVWRHNHHTTYASANGVPVHIDNSTGDSVEFAIDHSFERWVVVEKSERIVDCLGGERGLSKEQLEMDQVGNSAVNHNTAWGYEKCCEAA